MSKLRRMTSAYESGKIPEIQVHHRLRIAREWAGLEQSELADRIGISRQSVSKAESGKTEPRRITLNAWALATGVPVSWLRNGETPGTDGPGGDGDGGVTPPTPNADKSSSRDSAGQAIIVPLVVAA
ncbi:immunity repressor [Gordonia phage Doggs]|nr:immunity repressor [Gordonia phage Doggs]